MRELVEKLKREGVLKSPEIIEAFLSCNRKGFVPPEHADQAYVDLPLPIGQGQTISQPYTVAFMLELLKPEKGQKILDVGFGSGWTTALLASIVGEKGRVYGLEIAPMLYEFGSANLQRRFALGNIKLYNRSGWDGLPEEAPFDRILVSAAAPEEPEKLKEQLKTGGRMVLPIGGAAIFGQSVRLLKKNDDGSFEEEDHPGFAFVPLVE